MKTTTNSETDAVTPPTGQPDRPSAKLILVIGLAALLIRLGIGYAMIDRLSSDPDAYRAIATTIAATGVYGLTTPDGMPVPIAFRPPLYPIVLSLFVTANGLSTIAVVIFHAVLGAATAVLIFLTTIRLLTGDAHSLRAGIVAAALVTVDPILLQQSTVLMTETLAAAIVAMVFWWWVRGAQRHWDLGSAVGLGLLLSLAYLCRPTFLVWGLLLTLALLLRRTQQPLPTTRRILPVVMAIGILLSSVGLWAWRNLRQIGHPVWATTHGGYTLLLANNPLFYDYLKSDAAIGSVWDSQAFQKAYEHRYDGDPTERAFWYRPWHSPSAIERGEVEGVTEYDDDTRAYLAAKATIARRPADFVHASIVRILRLWSPWPHVTAGRSWATAMTVGTYYLGFYGLVAFGIYRQRWNWFELRWWPVAAMVVTLTVVHAVYWSNLRMRAPAIPLLACVAAAATGCVSRREIEITKEPIAGKGS